MARPRQVTDEAIFAAVREAVETHGPSVATSTIAEMVGLSQAALFKRFGTKEALFVKGLAPNPPVELFQFFAGGPTADRPFRDQLVELATALFKMQRDMLPRIHALLACGYGPDRIFKHFDAPPPVLMLRGMSTWFEVARERGLIGDDVDSTALAKALLGSLFFQSHIHKLAGDWLQEPDPEGYVESLVDILLDGIRPEVA
ncbi:MAG: TetR/AcrR family transcriptional regulator [Deltaproteobacteria bacterium]|nr:MAG: TetR/AcrR family transcriptional regulator [Deltaproteobacteria bacterium]